MREDIRMAIILLMNDLKYRTIDPLILETLNLNERRMNNILDILHGRQSARYPKTERKAVNRSLVNDRTTSVIAKALPPIFNSKAKEVQEQSRPDEKTKTLRKANHVVTNHSLAMDKSQAQLINKQHPHKQKPSPQEPGSKGHAYLADTINIQKQYREWQQSKKSQLMQDYMHGKLKHSKSQQINPKDVYRMEIEQLVSELTPIEQLQQVQKRMRRLKRKHKHLHSFDKTYYSKLNQHDMLVLF